MNLSGPWRSRLSRLANAALEPGFRRYYLLEKRAWRAKRDGRTSVRVDGRKTYFENPYHLAILYRDIFVDGVYDFETLNEKPVIIDCGANIGLSTIYFKQRHPGARVRSFEPDPDFAGILKKNVESWGLENVTVMESAVWSSEGTLRFQQDQGLGGHLADGGIEVRTERLKDYLSEPVDFLKIDIEGAELEVLRDCKDALGNVRRLFVESHTYAGQEQTLDEILEILRMAGYRYWIQRTEGPPRPFVGKPHEKGTLALCVNICATRDEEVESCAT